MLLSSFSISDFLLFSPAKYYQYIKSVIKWEIQEVIEYACACKELVNLKETGGISFQQAMQLKIEYFGEKDRHSPNRLIHKI